MKTTRKTKTPKTCKLFACPECDGGLTLDDPNYGLVCEPCGMRVAGPFTDAHEIPKYKVAK